MVERHHNRASEFACAVRASGRSGHRDSFARNYSTAFAKAVERLKLPRVFNTLEPFKSWRRGQCGPRLWAARLLANQLRENAQQDLELADQLEKEIGPGSPGKAGAAALRRWRNQHAETRNSESSS